MDPQHSGNPPAATPIQYVPVPVPPPPPRRRWLGFFSLALLAVLVLSLVLNFGLLGVAGLSAGRRLTEKHHSLSRTASTHFSELTPLA